MSNNNTFFSKSLELLNTLTSDSKPEWGVMTAQHMIEHIIGGWMISNGKLTAKQLIPDEEIEERLTFLRNDIPYPKNIQNPIFKDGLPPLRKDSITTAVNQLAEEMQLFDKFFKLLPHATPIHPVYGPIDHLDWLRFHEKHMRHHLRQFNLL